MWLTSLTALTLLLVVELDQVEGQKRPTISFISGAGSGEVVTDLGKSAELICQVKNGKEYPINWIKISGDKKEDYEYTPLSTGKTLAIKDARFKLNSEVQHDSLSTKLQIGNIEQIDAAIYQCQVIVGIGNKITKEVRLRVKTPVAILDSSTAKLTVVEGEEAKLECKVSGFPTPTITWERTDRKVFNSGSLTMAGPTMLVAKAGREDTGKYKCTAENSVGPAQTHEAELVVRFSPSIAVPRPRVHQAVGYDVILQCQMESFPDPTINWFKAGSDKALDNSGRFSVAHFTRGPTTTLTTLRIASLVADDFGSYECHAKNSHGETKALVELTETTVPIPEAAFAAGVSGVSSLLSVLLSGLFVVLAIF